MDKLEDLSVLDKIKKLEKEGMFNEHVDPFDENGYIPVDRNFNYFPHGLKNWLIRKIIVNRFVNHSAKNFIHLKIVGQENLKGLKGAVVTCNHINKLDCIAVMKACKGHKLRITTAEFNNQKGFVGDMMRAAGTMPIPSGLGMFRYFEEAVGKALSKNNLVLFYPEQSEWWNYKKPRPFKKGAFYMAAKFNVPVVPMFITLEETGEFYDNGLPISAFTIHVMKPIYPKSELSKNENIEYLKDLNFKMCNEKFSEVYENAKDKEDFKN